MDELSSGSRAVQASPHEQSEAAAEQTLLRGFAQFFAARLAAPLGVLVQMAVVARILPPEGFATYLQIYSLAVIVSNVSDGGQQYTLFAALRSDGRDRAGMHIGYALAVKIYVSAIAFLIALVLGLGIDANMAVIFPAVALGVMMPVGDIYLIALRGLYKPRAEFSLVVAEYAVVVGVLAVSASMWSMTPVTVVTIMMMVAGLRSLVARYLCYTIVRPHEKTRLSRFEPGRIRPYIVGAVPVTAGAFAAIAFNRTPAMALLSVMKPVDYAVFIAFLTMFARGEVTVSALIQAGFKSNNVLWRKYLSKVPVLVGSCVMVGLPVALVAYIAHDPLTKLLLGSDYMAASRFTVLAGATVILSYPLFATRTLLQFAGRHGIVIVGGGIGVAIQIALLRFMHPVDEMAVVPYLVAMAFYLAVCTIYLRARVDSREL